MNRETELIALRDSPRQTPTTPLEKTLAQVLDEAQGLLDAANREHKTDEGPVLASWLATLLGAAAPEASIEFIAVVDPKSLQFLETIQNEALVALAAVAGTERACDVVRIQRR
jgi:pantothenate synthetase